MPGSSANQFLPDFVQKARAGEPAELWIYSAYEKDGWLARQAGGFTRAEHPGTGIRMDDRLYEIFTIEAAAEPGYPVRYGLKPWDPSHTVRRAVHYTPAMQAQAAAEHLEEAHRQALRQRVEWMFPLAGLAPDPVQERWEVETALPMAAASIASCLFEIGVFATLVHVYGRFPSNTALAWLTDYLCVDGFLRLFLIVTLGRPRGLFLITAPYLLWDAAARPGKRAERKKKSDLLGEPDEIIRQPASGHLTVRSIFYDDALAGPAPIRFEGGIYRPLAWSLQDRGIRRRWVYEFERIEGGSAQQFREYARPRTPERLLIAEDLTRRYDRAQALGLVWGMYPQAEQGWLEAHYRFPSLRMTRATAALLGAGALLECWVGWMAGWPGVAYLLPAYFVVESVYRLDRAKRLGLPSGSVVGAILRVFLRAEPS